MYSKNKLTKPLTFFPTVMNTFVVWFKTNFWKVYCETWTSMSPLE